MNNTTSENLSWAIAKPPNILDVWNGYPEIFSFSQALEISRQYFLLRTVILQKKFAGCPWKMKICHDQDCNDIGVAMATKCRNYLLYLQQYLSLGTVLPKSFTGAFSSNSRLDDREVKTESVRPLSRYFRRKFLSLEIRLKKGKSWCLAVFCRKRGAFDMQFHLIALGVDKTRNTEHSGTFRNILEHPGTWKNKNNFMKKIYI